MIAREQKIKFLEAQVLSQLATLKLNSGDPKEAVKLSQESLEITQGLKKDNQWKNLSISLELLLFQQLDLTYEELGDTESQIKILNQYLQIAQQLNNEEIEGQTLYDIASPYLERSEFVVAIDYLDRSLKTAQK